jgi:uncharacterized protein with von Willebrand factor type A (vWA) domain
MGSVQERELVCVCVGGFSWIAEVVAKSCYCQRWRAKTKKSRKNKEREREAEQICEEESSEVQKRVVVQRADHMLCDAVEKLAVQGSCVSV